MGYSSTESAMNALDMVLDSNTSGHFIDNVWDNNKGQQCFFELGRERTDGSIIGRVHLERNGDGLYYFVGNVKIKADGYVSKFPHANKKMRKVINKHNETIKMFNRGVKFVLV